MCLYACENPDDMVDGECRICGDGRVTDGEECDDENNVNGDGCDENCTRTACGNGIETDGEDCDDGNDVEGDGCDSNCTPSGCGNEVVAPDEECDDGNAVDGDACDSNCTVPRCGNGIASVDENGDPEACDDANDVDTDACIDCVLARCGDGIVHAGVEACDDGNILTTDECTNDCKLSTCGDGDVDDGEECDDGNNNNDDDCRNNCLFACGEECICDTLVGTNGKLSVSIKVPTDPAEDAVTFKIDIPGLGKGVETKFNFLYTAEGQIPDCKVDCKGSFGGSIAGSWSATVLTESVSAAIGGGFSIEQDRCQLCDTATCLESCGEVSCDRVIGTGMASVGYTKTLPLFPERRLEWGPIKGRAGCSVSLGGGLGLSGSVKDEDPGAAMLCEKCGRCQTFGGKVEGTVTLAGSCTLGLNAGGAVNASISGGLTGTVKPEISYDYETGPGCANPGLCGHAKVSAEAMGALSGCVALKFFNAKASCDVKFSGSAEAGCKGFDSEGKGPDFACNATATIFGGDCSAECERICRRGKPCGDTCISRTAQCRRPPGKACQGPAPEMDE